MVASKGEWRIAPHLQLLDDALLDVATGDCQRLIVEMPPRSGKSQLCSKYYPSWYLGTFPQRNVILTSATDDLAQECSRTSRDLLQEFGGKYFGANVRSDRSATQRWGLQEGGGLRAAGVGGGIMGQGADLLIIDDFFKNTEEALSATIRRKISQWYYSTSSTRLAPGGAIVIICTRWHPEDLIGDVLKTAEVTGEKWRRIQFPAIAEVDDELGRKPGDALWPEMWPIEVLEKKRAEYHASGYPWMWEALYQQRPPAAFDATWDAALFGQHVMFDSWPDPSTIQFKVVVLDPSLGGSETSDYSAYIMMAVDVEGVMWVDADICRRDTVQIVEDGYSIASWFQPHSFGVEKVGFQQVLEVLFDQIGEQKGMRLPYYGISNHKNKVQRIIASLTPRLKRGEYRFKRNSPGVNLLLEQLRGFPSHRYKDGPDALEMATRLAWHVFSEEAA